MVWFSVGTLVVAILVSMLLLRLSSSGEKDRQKAHNSPVVVRKVHNKDTNVEEAYEKLELCENIISER
jgi:hypothetical protein